MPLRRPPCPEDPSRHFLDGQSHLKLLRVGFQRAMPDFFGFFTTEDLMEVEEDIFATFFLFWNDFFTFELCLQSRTWQFCVWQRPRNISLRPSFFLYPYGISASLRWARILWATLNFAYPIWVCDRLYQSNRTFLKYIEYDAFRIHYYLPD